MGGVVWEDAIRKRWGNNRAVSTIESHGGARKGPYQPHCTDVRSEERARGTWFYIDGDRPSFNPSLTEEGTV